MAERRIYLREWRKHRGLTQDDVVDRLAIYDDPNLPKTGASLSRIENGKQPYSQRIMEALADIYDCEVWELIGRNPSLPGNVIDLMSRLDERKRAQVVAVIEALIKADGTGG